MITLTVQNLPPVQHNGFRVITTELLANVYETEINNIQQNFKRNKKRFIEGKHYFKVVGDALNNLRLTVSHLQISSKVRSLILWTERGAARHAKILDTDNAWDVFEALEDFYFAKKEDAQQKISIRQSTAKELTPLRQTAERLIATGVGNIYPDIWKYVHKEFGVEHINELLPEQIPQAISFLDALEGEYLPKQEALPVPKLEIDYPLTWYPDNFPFVDMCFYKNGQLKVTQSMLTETKSPSKEILSKLESAGYDVTAAKAEIESLRHTMIEMSWALGQIASFAKMKDVVNKTFTA